MIDRPGPAMPGTKNLQTWLQIPQGFAVILPEVPASSAIAIASEEVPQVQDLEVDLSKIDLAELVWGLGVSNLNTQNVSLLPKPCVEVLNVWHLVSLLGPTCSLS